ncbi:hypothetical protein DKX38_028379 [Salix brachista]|uniref:AP2/ERF domain-containing protein n=1 Tax=Salix brachista TaxID=2182728 RepID=A0A5N5JAL7_9ROSI|nr:hypothetical protein DKX38_028379 [Salix brachista]
MQSTLVLHGICDDYCSGAYDDEEAAAHAYDLAALKYWGSGTILNFPLSTYQNKLKEMEVKRRVHWIIEKLILTCIQICRKSSGFSRGVSKYRGVARHHHNGRWEARIGRVCGNKYLHLGTYATNPSSALGLLLRSSKFKEMMEMTAVADCPQTPSPGLDLTPCSFLEDVQTYFDRHDSSGYGDQADDMIFGDLSSYVPPMFQCDFET